MGTPLPADTKEMDPHFENKEEPTLCPGPVVRVAALTISELPLGTFFPSFEG